MEYISYQDFAKLDIRIGKILNAEAVQGTDRLIQLRVDIGEEDPRQLVAGLKQYYSPEEMVGKQIVVLVNICKGLATLHMLVLLNGIQVHSQQLT